MRPKTLFLQQKLVHRTGLFLFGLEFGDLRLSFETATIHLLESPFQLHLDRSRSSSVVSSLSLSSQAFLIRFTCLSHGALHACCLGAMFQLFSWIWSSKSPKNLCASRCWNPRTLSVLSLTAVLIALVVAEPRVVRSDKSRHTQVRAETSLFFGVNAPSSCT
jgi:hypothetical protein